MIYLLDGSEFEPELYCGNGSIKRILADFKMSDIIYDKLQLASQTNELIHTQWLRGIGKTYELVQFAKVNEYAVLEPMNIGAEAIREKENYRRIYSNIKTLKEQTDIKNIVIDEGVTNLQELKDAGFNIITGFYTPKKESEMSFQEKVLNTLKNEIEALTPKIQQTRENRDYGTYKNLINAYREVLNLIRDFKIR